MTGLYERLAAKMLERPETNYAGATDADGGNQWVYKHLAGTNGQMLLTSYEDPMFTVYAAAGVRGPRPSAHDFWVTPDTGGRWQKGAGRVPATIPESDIAAVLSAVPLMQPDSVYAYSRQCGAAPEVLGYWQRAEKISSSPLRPCWFMLEGFEAGSFTADAPACWREVDAGRLRCLDEDLALGMAALTVELDGRGYFKLVLDGRDFFATDVLPGGPVKKIPWAGDPAAMAKVAKDCIADRQAAARALGRR